MGSEDNTVIMNELYGMGQEGPYYASLVVDLYFRDPNMGLDQKTPHLAQQRNKTPDEIQRDIVRIERILEEGLGFELLEHLGLSGRIVISEGRIHVRE